MCEEVGRVSSSLCNDFHNAYIVEFKNAVPDAFCDELIKLCDKLYDEKAERVYTEDVKTSIDVPINIRNRYQFMLNEKYHSFINKKKHEYSDILIRNGLDVKTFNTLEKYILESKIKNSTQSNIIIQKSNTGDYYKWHSDSWPGEERILTCILYLNTLDDDAGGTTRFLSGKEIKPEKGKLVIFPSTISYIHQGDTVKKGPKYIITTFSSLGNYSQQREETSIFDYVKFKE